MPTKVNNLADVISNKRIRFKQKTVPLPRLPKKLKATAIPLGQMA
jgi:hypothetical protein